MFTQQRQKTPLGVAGDNYYQSARILYKALYSGSPINLAHFAKIIILTHSLFHIAHAFVN